MKRNNKISPPRGPSFDEFCILSSINSFRYLQERPKGFLHILLWICINVFFIGLTATLIWILWNTLKENPTVVSLESRNYPIDKLAFPGISVCSINKISKKRITQMASLISKTTNISLKIVNDYVAVLTSLYDYDDSNYQKMTEFQKIIEEYADLNELTKITKLMKMLAPSCEEFLLNCTWKNEIFNCNEIFKMRLTFEGYCCVFNYVKRTVEIAEQDVPKQVQKGKPGLQNGLSVVINNGLNDYYFSRHASLGANIHVFYPYDYPDKNSGGLSEYIVGTGTEFFMEIGIMNLRTVGEVIKHPVEKRSCYFYKERLTPFGYYSESDCILECRINSMLALCGCVPFIIPIGNQKLVCSLSDLDCLHKYRLKWKSIAPPEELHEDASLSKEAQNSLDCGNKRCYPACDAIQYIANINAVSHRNPSFGNNSVIRIYYGHRFATVYKQDAVYYWYDMLSNFGGAFGLTIGFSVISAIEIIIFVVCKVVRYVQDNFDTARNFK